MPGDLETSPLLPESEVPLKFPVRIAYIIGTEFCERFSFYGTSAILFVYMTSDNSTALYHTFKMMCYAFTVIGAILGDRYWGRFNTILRLCLLYSLGFLILSVTSIPFIMGDVPLWIGMTTGLALIAFGTGGIKPCVSAFGGDQLDPISQARELSTFFALFYFSVNCGSVLSMIITPLLRTSECFGRDDCFPIAFFVPTALMLIASTVFAAGSSTYIKVPIAKAGESAVDNLLNVTWITIKSYLVTREDGKRGFNAAINATYSSENVADVRRVLEILLLFSPLPVFWALYDQQSSRWTAQALIMNNHFNIFGHSIVIPPESMQTCNAVLILIFIPLFEQSIYPKLRMVFDLTPTRKITIGMALVGFSFLIASFLQFSIEALDPVYIDKQCVENCIGIYAQIPQYIIITAGEVFFSITGLQFAYSQSPPSMKSLCQSSWQLTVAFGNLYVIIIAQLKYFSPGVELMFFAFSLFAATAVFVLLSFRFNARVRSMEHE